MLSQLLEKWPVKCWMSIMVILVSKSSTISSCFKKSYENYEYICELRNNILLKVMPNKINLPHILATVFLKIYFTSF